MDDPRGDRLYDLLLALFSSDEELQRFLALAGISTADTRSYPSKTRNLAESSYETVQALLRDGRADEKFFRLLEQRAPDRIEDIHKVERLFTTSEGDDHPASPDDPDAAPAEYAEFAKLLERELAGTEAPSPQEVAVDVDHVPWTAAASVLGSFNPMHLKPLPGPHGSDLRATSALADLVIVSHRGRWVLRDDARSAALLWLDERHRLDEAVALNAQLDDPRRTLLQRVLAADEVVLAELDQQGLVDLDAVLGWLEPLGLQLRISRVAVQAAADRRSLMAPLRLLVGTHFRGREQELSVVRRRIGEDGAGQGGSPDPLSIVGAGGAGKSSLVGKVLLELEERVTFDPVSFAYIDFDKARNDPRDRAGFVRQLSRQLRLLYATSADASRTFAALESMGGGTDLTHAAELLDIDQDLGPSELLDHLCRSLHDLRGGHVPLVLVLDTCEEVLSRGPGAVRDLLFLLHDIGSRLPEARILLAGRALLPLPGSADPDNVLNLGDLDRDAADAVLENRGVRRPELRELILERFGRNPLTLRLAAEALTRAETAQEAFDGVGTPGTAYAEIALEQVQGMLYTRILGHIRDPEVAKVAHPGLAVRLVTVPVIREVLAVPCGLDPARADEVFRKLRAELTLFEEESPGVLSHRQDVRRLMLRTMADDPRRRQAVQEIHAGAIRFYGRRQDVQARTEELYHRIMADEDPRGFAHLWDDAVRPGLESALEEPLPERARRWLERRLSRIPESVDRSEWEQGDWEAEAATRARSWLASQDPTSALAVLAEREDRLPGSVLHALDVAVRLALDDVPGASAHLDRGLREGFDVATNATQLELLEQAVELRARQGDAAGLLDSATGCVSLADLLGDPDRGTRTLSKALARLREMGDTSAAQGAQRILAARFRMLDRDQMRDNPDLVREVLHTLGPVDAEVLVHAAIEMGDQTSAATEVFTLDPFAVGRILDDTTPSAGPALQDLAVEVGLPRDKWDLDELASRLVRTGRTGKAIVVGLDHAEDGARMRAAVVDSLVLPVGPSSKRSS